MYYYQDKKIRLNLTGLNCFRGEVAAYGGVGVRSCECMGVRVYVCVS